MGGKRSWRGLCLSLHTSDIVDKTRSAFSWPTFSNVIVLDTAAIQALGLSPNLSVASTLADTHAPTVTSLSITPALINTTASSQPVTVLSR